MNQAKKQWSNGKEIIAQWNDKIAFRVKKKTKERLIYDEIQSDQC